MAFATPPVVTHALAVAPCDYIQSVVYHHDVVPRASLANFERLRQEMLSQNWESIVENEVFPHPPFKPLPASHPSGAASPRNHPTTNGARPPAPPPPARARPGEGGGWFAWVHIMCCNVCLVRNIPDSPRCQVYISQYCRGSRKWSKT